MKLQPFNFQFVFILWHMRENMYKHLCLLHDKKSPFQQCSASIKHEAPLLCTQYSQKRSKTCLASLDVFWFLLRSCSHLVCVFLPDFWHHETMLHHECVTDGCHHGENFLTGWIPPDQVQQGVGLLFGVQLADTLLRYQLHRNAAVILSEMQADNVLMTGMSKDV